MSCVVQGKDSGFYAKSKEKLLEALIQKRNIKLKTCNYQPKVDKIGPFSFHNRMLVLPVLQGKHRDLRHVWGREFLPSHLPLGLQGSRVPVPIRPSGIMNLPSQKGHPNWGVPSSYFQNSYSASMMCSPSQYLSEDTCQLLCGGWAGGGKMKLGTLCALSSLLQHYTGQQRIFLGRH